MTGRSEAVVAGTLPVLMQLVIDAIPNAVLLVNHAGIVEVANARAERLFAYPSGELNGIHIDQLVPERYRSNHHRYRSSFIANPGTREMGAGRELFGLRRDGSEVAIEVGLDVLKTAEMPHVLASVYDATERRDALQRAAQATALSQSIIDCAPFAIIATDTEGRVLEVSPAAERMLQIERDALIGKAVPIRLHDSRDPARRIVEVEPMDNTLAGDCAEVLERVSYGQTDEREWLLQRNDGSRLAIDLAISGLRDSAGALTGYIGIANDISERKRAESEIRHMAEHDALTGLPNRILLRDRLDVSLVRARRSQSHVAVLLIDLDHFKHINDSLGHHVGDRLLKSVARRLLQAIRGGDTVARMGGDEFVVVLPDLHSTQDAYEVAAKIVEKLSEPVTVDMQTLEITPSIGVCTFPEDGDNVDVLLMNADTAMYAAKDSGRRRYMAFTPQMAAAASERWALERALRRTLESDGFEVHYQPQIHLASGTVFGVEALLRWPQDDEHYLSPAHFIHVAEQAGLVVPIGERVLRRACHDIAALAEHLPADFRLSVNLSPRQLRLATLPALVAECLSEAGLSPHRLELEITESALLQDDITHTIEELRATGVAVAIDDFGTGFSSLSHVTRFPIDGLKVDCSFVNGIENDPSQAAVTAAIIAMSRRLGIKTIAEGIETDRQRKALLDLGCELGQGYLFSKAVPTAQLLGAITRRYQAEP